MKKLFTQILSFLFLAVLIFQSCEITEKEPRKKSVEIIQKESVKENDTLNIIYFENKEIKEVDLKDYEGEKNVRLYFSKEGYLKQKTVNFDSYPQTNYEFNKNKIITHKWFEADIGGCVAISGKESFMDEKGFVVKDIVHTSYGNSCSEKILVNEIIEYFVKSKSVKSIYFTRESYEGSEECPCGFRKEFNADGSVKSEQKFKDCESESSECDQDLSENIISISSKWYGNYFFTITSKDNLNGTDYKINLNISKDSIIYSAEGYQIYQKFSLSGEEKNDKLFLNFLDSKDGSYSRVLEKTKDFGVISNIKGNFVWESPYLNNAFSDVKTVHNLRK